MIEKQNIIKAIFSNPV